MGIIAGIALRDLVVARQVVPMPEPMPEVSQP